MTDKQESLIKQFIFQNKWQKFANGVIEAVTECNALSKPPFETVYKLINKLKEAKEAVKIDGWFYVIPKVKNDKAAKSIQRYKAAG